MSKMSELSVVLQELKECGEKLVSVSEELKEIFSEAEPEKKKAPAKKKEPDAKPEPEEPKKEYTFTEVRTFLADKSRAGHTAEVKKILAAHGADKLSDLDKAEYAAVMAEAEVLE
ncbi:MAG: DNA ligase [Lachnospiraceae bacterium]|nr:DNA ligase [Lachnospiraceae bacterium]